MTQRPTRSCAAMLAASFLLLSAAAVSAQTSSEKRYFRGFYFGALYSSISDPTFRLPSGYGELPVLQSASGPSFMAGYDIGGGGFGIGARLFYFRAGFSTFAFSEQPGSPFPNFATYADPKFSHASFDLLVHWLPFRGLTLGVYALLGLAMSTESYLISGSVFPEWNGNQSRTNFDYSYGLGIRFSPAKMMSVFAELRFIPGDLTTEYTGYLYSDDTYDYFRNARTFTANITSLLSAGLSVNF
jgi:hypothetical protein